MHKAKQTEIQAVRQPNTHTYIYYTYIIRTCEYATLTHIHTSNREPSRHTYILRAIQADGRTYTRAGNQIIQGGIHTHTHTYKHTYVRTYTHTNIHTHTYTNGAANIKRTHTHTKRHTNNTVPIHTNITTHIQLYRQGEHPNPVACRHIY